jgi:hypothetical protein
MFNSLLQNPICSVDTIIEIALNSDSYYPPTFPYLFCFPQIQKYRDFVSISSQFQRLGDKTNVSFRLHRKASLREGKAEWRNLFKILPE